MEFSGLIRSPRRFEGADGEVIPEPRHGYIECNQMPLRIGQPFLDTCFE
jgi:hypothetical protein